MIKFIVGLFIGTFIGMTIMAMVSVNKDNEGGDKDA